MPIVSIHERTNHRKSKNSFLPLGREDSSLSSAIGYRTACERRRRRRRAGRRQEPPATRRLNLRTSILAGKGRRRSLARKIFGRCRWRTPFPSLYFSSLFFYPVLLFLSVFFFFLSLFDTMPFLIFIHLFSLIFNFLWFIFVTLSIHLSFFGPLLASLTFHHHLPHPSLSFFLSPVVESQRGGARTWGSICLLRSRPPRSGHLLI